jgi:hypothetical protein
VAVEDGRLIVDNGRAEISWLRDALADAERKSDLQDAKWYQIHANGGTTTFARYYASPDGTGEFEKLAVDHINDTNELFGGEHYHDWQDAKTRLRVAIKEGM